MMNGDFELVDAIFSAKDSVRRNKRVKRLKLAGIVAIPVVLLAVGAFIFWQYNHINEYKLLTKIAGQPVTAFTPYYFNNGRPPDGYKVMKDQSQYSNGILQITLQKSSNQSLVLTEQARPNNLNASNLLIGTSSIKGAAGPAGVNNVEGRDVGTLIPTAHQTLILITSTTSSAQSDITTLLQSLQAAQPD